MLEKSIQDFPSQFKFRLRLENPEKIKNFEQILVAGMGGSAFPVELIKIAQPDLDLNAWRSYDLPIYASQQKPLFICSSYSGNTEETLSAFEKAFKQRLNLAAISAGGKLLSLAKKHKVPYIQIPDTKIQPRMSTGFFVSAISKIIGLKNEKELRALSKSLKPLEWKKKGEALSQSLWDQIPVFYASEKNSGLARVWKIKFNENTKIPAFWNFFPELNHNEMTGFDVTKTTSALNANLHLVFLTDKNDHIRQRKRFEITKKLLTDRGLVVSFVEISGSNPWEKIFNSLLLADWSSLSLAKYYGVEPEAVPMVEEFKKRIR